MPYYQAGDVIMSSVECVPSGSTPVEGDVIHRGLNHTHNVTGDFSMHERDGVVYLRAGEGCVLTHAEHGTIALPVGTYRKSIVKEYDHWTEESREVID